MGETRLNFLGVPIGPVEPVLEYGQGERMSNDLKWQLNKFNAMSKETGVGLEFLPTQKLVSAAKKVLTKKT